MGLPSAGVTPLKSASMCAKHALCVCTDVQKCFQERAVITGLFCAGLLWCCQLKYHFSFHNQEHRYRN